MHLKHLKRLMDMASKTPEEQQKHLEQLRSTPIEPINKKISFESNNSPELVAIHKIPDIYTFVGWAGCALAIVNSSNKTVNYWYTYDGSQKWHYKYTIDPSESTWNWLWSDSYTHHSMIIEIPVENDESWFYALAFKEFYQPGYEFAEIPLIILYRAKAQSDNPPLFSQAVWESLGLEGPGHKTLDWMLDFHATVVCNDDNTLTWKESM